MSFDSMLGNVGIYVAVISALAIGVERIMDYVKSFPGTKGKLVRNPLSVDVDENERKKEEKIEEKRQREIRLLAVPVGLIFAFVIQVDTFDILGLYSPLWFGIPILGYLLSGLAASRGSAFWHDIIDLVGAIKETKKRVAEPRRGER